MVSLISRERKFNSETACCAAFCACTTHNGCSTCCLWGIGQNFSFSPRAPESSAVVVMETHHPPSELAGLQLGAGRGGTRRPSSFVFSGSTEVLCRAAQLSSAEMLLSSVWVSFHSHSSLWFFFPDWKCQAMRL